MEPPIRQGEDMELQEKRRTGVDADKFLESVQNGYLQTVTETITPELTTLVTNQGVSALEKAVESGEMEMVKLFLNNTQEVDRADFMEYAILYTIKEDDSLLLSYLLAERAKDSKKGSKSGNWNEHKNEIPGYEDAEFAPYITPMILAAKLERQEMIKQLLANKVYDIHPITAECDFPEGKCEICAKGKFYTSKMTLEDSKRLLEIYKALSSPAYIFLAVVEDPKREAPSSNYTYKCGVDPILEAFCLSHEMYEMQDKDPSFKSEYDEIAKRCRTFATELLALCRTTSEVEVLLQNRHGLQKVNLNGDKTKYPKILLGLHYNQKEFLVHPYTQQVLQKDWMDGLPKWYSECTPYNCWLFFLLYFISWIFFTPVSSLVFLFAPSCTCLKKPINKFVTSTLSWGSFIILMFIICIYQNSDDDKQKNFQTIEYVFIAWLVGMWCRQIKIIWRQRYIAKGSKCCFGRSVIVKSIRWLDLSILLSFLLWLILKVIAILVANLKKEFLRRDQWPQYHPILISEAFFALGTILSFFKLTSLMKASSSLGPLQISLKNMIWDTVRFMFIFFIIMAGFVIATTSIYSHYKENLRIQNGKATRTQSDNYIGWQNTFKTYFWDIFGYGEVEYGDIVVNYTDAGNQTAAPVPKHKFTEGVGYLIIASYFIIVAVVLLNMLIAMMANSYNAIAANADSEWKYARTQLRMTYYSEVGALQPPFNLLGIIRMFLCKCCKESKEEKEKEKDSSYSELMHKLNKRYWNHRRKEERRQRLISRDRLDKAFEDNPITETIHLKRTQAIDAPTYKI